MPQYQIHCQFCQKRYSGETPEEALKKVEEHEKETDPKKQCPKKK